jgi:uncharacterized protein
MLTAVNFNRTPSEEAFRQFMLNMFNHTAYGLGVSFITAFGIYSMGLLPFFMTGPMAFVTMLAPFAMIIWYAFKGQDWDLQTMHGFYYAFVAIMGVGLSGIFLRYTSTSIVEAFLVSSLTFGAASFYGHTTKRDLSGIGGFLMMGLIGLLIAIIVNFFLQSSMFSFIISIIGVLIFVGLTMWDVQRAKEIFAETQDPVYGLQMALSLYLNFVNIFQFILSLTGMTSDE